MPKGVLLDTSFFLRFLNSADPLFKNADDYFRYFLKNDFSLFISTISVAEFCVGNNRNKAQRQRDDHAARAQRNFDQSLEHISRVGRC